METGIILINSLKPMVLMVQNSSIKAKQILRIPTFPGEEAHRIIIITIKMVFLKAQIITGRRC